MLNGRFLVEIAKIFLPSFCFAKSLEIEYLLDSNN